MLIETNDDGGGEDFSLGDECPKEMPCIDCGDACKPKVHKATCTIGDKKIKCSDNGMWDYADGGGGEDFSLGAGAAAGCPKEIPCIDCGDKCKPKVDKGTCPYDGRKSIKCSANGMWDYV